MIDIYYHCQCIGAWRYYFETFFNRLKWSNLYQSADRVFIVCDGNFDYEDDKFHISRYRDKFVDEFPTLRMIRDNAKHCFGSALYYRGFTGSDEVGDRISIEIANDALSHHLIYGHHECLDVLADRDVVGINLDKNNAGYWYFEDNCWWARYEYLKGLDMDVGVARLWVLSGADKGRISCLNQKANR